MKATKRKCYICKSTFSTTYPTKKYCCEACKKIGTNNKRNELYRYKNNIKQLGEIKCKECSLLFNQNAPNHIFCSFSCRNKDRNRRSSTVVSQNKHRNSEKRKEWYKKYYKTDLYKESELKKKGKPTYKKEKKKNYIKYQKSFKGKINSIKYDKKRLHNLSRVNHLFTEKEYSEKLKLSKGICLVCNKTVGIKKLTMDHIIPISKDGFEYKINDIQFLCRSCNCSKGDKIE